jgi:hypothetical protein
MHRLTLFTAVVTLDDESWTRGPMKSDRPMASDPSILDRLEGVKAIAGYLGVSSKTVERWEKLYGLPVRREARGTRAIVFARRSELDDWRVSREKEPDRLDEALSNQPERTWTLRSVRLFLGRPRWRVITYGALGALALLFALQFFGRTKGAAQRDSQGELAAIAGPWPGNNLVANGGFEIQEPIGSAHPDSFARWSGDLSAIVEEQHGVTPAEGKRMLRFLCTRPDRPSSDTAASDQWQLVDLRRFRKAIDAGRLEVFGSCVVNRIVGSEFTDSDFSYRIYAFDGELIGWPDRIDRAELCSIQGLVESDADPLSWQPLTVRLRVPTGTQFLAIDVSAVENKRNDADFPELDGHYVDAVNLVIEPASVSANVR